MSITAAGRAQFDQAVRLHAVSLREVFAGFSAKDLAQFDSLLDRLRPT